MKRIFTTIISLFFFVSLFSQIPRSFQKITLGESTISDACEIFKANGWNYEKEYSSKADVKTIRAKVDFQFNGLKVTDLIIYSYLGYIMEIDFYQYNISRGESSFEQVGTKIINNMKSKYPGGRTSSFDGSYSTKDDKTFLHVSFSSTSVCMMFSDIELSNLSRNK